MEEFINSIENDVPQNLEDLKSNYLKRLKELYPNIHSYKDKDILEHYRLLSLREPKSGPTDVWTVGPIWEKKHPLGDVSLQDFIEDYEPPKVLRITRQDLRISDKLKSRVRGVMICLSPKENYYPSVQSFLERVEGTNCKQIKSAKYYIEFFTKNSSFKPHVHMYAQLYDYKSVNKNRLRSYFKKRFPFMKTGSIEYKPDITYGITDYISGKSSDELKQQNKTKDHLYREENKIPHILTL